MGTTETRAIARGYFEAWSRRQGADVVAAFLADDFEFVAGPMRIQGRDAFLSAGEWPEAAVTVMVADAYDGDRGFQLYEATNGAARVRIAERLTVSGDRIAASEVIADGAAFAAFMAAPA